MDGQPRCQFHVAHLWRAGLYRTYLQLELASGFRRIDMQEGKVFHGAAPGRFDNQFDEACSGLACVQMRSQSVIMAIGGILSSSMNSIESYNTGELIWIWVSLGYLDKPG